MLDHATTGDGTLTALQLVARVAATGKPLAELAAVMDRLPQVLVNVRDVDQEPASRPARRCWRPCAPAEAELGETGRVLLRPSGTEPLVRVMVEARRPGRRPTRRRLAVGLAAVPSDGRRLGAASTLRACAA